MEKRFDSYLRVRGIDLIERAANALVVDDAEAGLYQSSVAVVDVDVCPERAFDFDQRAFVRRFKREAYFDGSVRAKPDPRRGAGAQPLQEETQRNGRSRKLGNEIEQTLPIQKTDVAAFAFEKVAAFKVGDGARGDFFHRARARGYLCLGQVR